MRAETSTGAPSGASASSSASSAISSSASGLPAGRPVQARGRLGRHAAEQRRRLLAAQPGDAQRGQAGVVEQRRLVLARGQHDRDRIGQRRRSAKRSASAVEPSSHCASSISTTSGADSASSPSVAAPTAKRSCACAGRSASALSSASACGAGSCSRPASAGRSSSNSPANGICASDGHAARPQHGPPRRLLRRPVEQARLADPRLARQREHRAASASSREIARCSRSRPTSTAGSSGPRLGAPRRQHRRAAHSFGPPRRQGGQLMATIEQPPVDMEALMGFVFRAVDEVGATLNAALVVMGDKLGLYRALAGTGGLTPAELARGDRHDRALRARVAERPGGGRLRGLRPRQRPLHARPRAGRRADRSRQPGLPARLLPDRDRRGASTRRASPRPCAAATASAGTSTRTTCSTAASASSAPATTRTWSPSGCPRWTAWWRSSSAARRVADVGCGHGASTILMAQAFPKSTFFGSDYHGGSIETARERAERGRRRRRACDVRARARRRLHRRRATTS